MDDAAMVERLTAHFPAGTSVKDMDHYSQWIKQDPPFFGRFDYGKARGRYETVTPAAATSTLT